MYRGAITALCLLLFSCTEVLLVLCLLLFLCKGAITALRLLLFLCNKSNLPIPCESGQHVLCVSIWRWHETSATFGEQPSWISPNRKWQLILHFQFKPSFIKHCRINYLTNLLENPDIKSLPLSDWKGWGHGFWAAFRYHLRDVAEKFDSSPYPEYSSDLKMAAYLVGCHFSQKNNSDWLYPRPF